MQGPHVIAATISKAVAESRNKTLTGSQLSFVLKSAHPDFNPLEHQANNLRAFIREFVPDLIERGRAGADVVYGINRPETDAEQIPLFESISRPQTPLDSLLTDQRVWKTFASPQSPWQLFLDRRTGVVKVIGPSDPTPTDGDWVNLPHCSAEVLLQIARDFVATAPEAFRAILTGTLQENKWWLPFFDVLQGVGLRTKWTAYRRRRIVMEFERVVTTAIRETAPPALDDKLQKDHSNERQSIPTAGHSMIRKLAVEAVTRMAESELRSLNLPLGYVIDALNAR